MTTLIVLFVLGWLVCGVLAYGIYFGHEQRAWPLGVATVWYARDMKYSFFLMALGYAGIVLALKISGGIKHGLKFW